MTQMYASEERLWLEPPAFDYGPKGNAEAWQAAQRYVVVLSELADKLGNDIGNEALIYAFGELEVRVGEQARRAQADCDLWAARQ